MANFFAATKLHKLCLYCTLTAFSMTYAIPQVHAQQWGIGGALNEANLMLRLEKIVDRLMKLEKKGSVNEMLDLMLDAKGEIENFLGIRIYVEDNLNYVQSEMQKKGYKIPKKQFDNLKKQIKTKEKKNKEHARYVAMVLENGTEFNAEEEALLFQPLMAKHGKDKDDDKEENKIEVPIRVAFGVTVALCGLFLVCLPMPPAKVWGERLIETGVLIAVEGGISHREKEQDKEKK